MTYFSRGTFGASAPTSSPYCPQCGVLTNNLADPYCDACMQQRIDKMTTKYWLLAGSRVTRFSTTGTPGQMFTTKDVYYNESDITSIEYHEMDDFPGTPDKDNPSYYTINLPPEAMPFTHIRVEAQFVLVTDEKDSITPVDSAGPHRTGELSGLTVQEITDVLGFAPNVEDDPDKVVNSWGFKYKNKECGIWDYKGSHHGKSFSTYGPKEIFVELFGEKFVK